MALLRSRFSIQRKVSQLQPTDNFIHPTFTGVFSDKKRCISHFLGVGQIKQLLEFNIYVSMEEIV